MKLWEYVEPYQNFVWFNFQRSGKLKRGLEFLFPLKSSFMVWFPRKLIFIIFVHDHCKTKIKIEFYANGGPLAPLSKFENLHLIQFWWKLIYNLFMHALLWNESKNCIFANGGPLYPLLLKFKNLRLWSNFDWNWGITSLNMRFYETKVKIELFSSGNPTCFSSLGFKNLCLWSGFYENWYITSLYRGKNWIFLNRGPAWSPAPH